MVKKLSIIVPVYNEEETLQLIFSRMMQVPLLQYNKEFIFIDDCSNDRSLEILYEIKSLNPQENIIILKHEKNQGKGRAIRTGFENFTGDLVLIQDADLEYHPNDYPKLLKPFEETNADVVYGSRFLGGSYVRVLYFWHYLGNRVLTFFSNMLTNLNLTDMETCYKVFKREVIQKISLTSNRFGMEPEITSKIARLHCAIYEVPISYEGRTYADGKKITWKDGIAALWHIIKFNIFR